MSKDYPFYLNQFIANVSLTEHIDYASKTSVRQNNRAVDEYRKAAYMIGKEFPEKMDDFARLLENDNAEVRICCAVCIVELMPADPTTKTKAIQQIKVELEAGNATPEYGWELWLKKHDAEHRL